MAQTTLSQDGRWIMSGSRSVSVEDILVLQLILLFRFQT